MALTHARARPTPKKIAELQSEYKKRLLEIRRREPHLAEPPKPSFLAKLRKLLQ